MRGENNDKIPYQSLIYAQNKYGIDSPVASVGKRISWYGNTEDLSKQIEQLHAEYGNDFTFDKRIFVAQESNVVVPEGVFGGQLRAREMNELDDLLAPKKKAGLIDMRLLSLDKPKNMLDPSQQIYARSVKLRILDLD